MGPDINRLQKTYQQRTQRKAADNRYSVFDPAFFFSRVQRQRAVLKMLSHHGMTRLADLRILEVGCGNGSVMQELSTLGAKQRNMVGVDLLRERLVRASGRLARSKLICSDGGLLPFCDGGFDLVLQFTALSSILDARARRAAACEMLRVLAPGGLILWYDFLWNPGNHETHGIGKQEIRDSFPGCSFTFTRMTLAPPIARRVVPVSWPLGMALESLRVFNSHYLVGIRKSLQTG